MKNEDSQKSAKIFVYGVFALFLVLGFLFSYKIYLAGLAGVLFFPAVFAYIKRRKSYTIMKRIRCLLALLLIGLIPGILIYIAWDSTSQDGPAALLRGSVVAVLSELIPLSVGLGVICDKFKSSQTKPENNQPLTGNITYEPSKHRGYNSPYTEEYYRRQNERIYHKSGYRSGGPYYYRNSEKSMDDLNGWEFEKYCADILRHTTNFVNVQVTPGSGDKGADIVAVDKRGRRWIWQCKRYKSKLGPHAVQEVVTAKAHYKAEMAGVMTNSTLGPTAWELANENHVVVIDRNRMPNLRNGRTGFSGPMSFDEMIFYDMMDGE